MDIYKIIQDVGDILGISITQPPIVYEDETNEYDNDTLKRSIKYKIVKENEDFVYLVHDRGLGKYRCDSMILNTTKDVHDVFVQFIRDSYYDSPIRFNNWKRHIEKMIVSCYIITSTLGISIWDYMVIIIQMSSIVYM